MPGPIQRLKRIDHGQPGANDQHPCIHRQTAQCLHIPRVQRGRVKAAGLALRRTRGREHAGGQNGHRRLQLTPVLEGHLNPVLLGLQVDGFVTHMGQA